MDAGHGGRSDRIAPGLGTAPRFLGRYRVVAELARGSTSVVYLGIVGGPGGFNKLFALKQLRAALAEDPTNVAMFLAEARLAGRLSHSNVVSTLEIEEESALPYIVMEYLDGQPLFRASARARMAGVPLSIPMHLAILNDAVEGLSYAHQALGYDGAPLRVVHRDVSPHNVFVTYGGQTKLLDFGVAQSREAEGPRQGSPRGKVAYMSPEQAAGMNVDARADIFAIGVMLWEAVTGQRFWAQTTSEAHVLELLASGRSPLARESALAGTPPDLQYIIINATEPDPADRYESAASLQADLQVVFRRMVPSGFNVRDVGRRLAEIFADDRARLQAAIDTQLELTQGTGEGAPVPRFSAQASVPPPRATAEPDEAPTPYAAALQRPAPASFAANGMSPPAMGSPVSAAFSPSTSIGGSPASGRGPWGRAGSASPASSPPSSGISRLRAGQGVAREWLEQPTAVSPRPGSIEATADEASIDDVVDEASIDDDWTSDDALDAYAVDRAASVGEPVAKEPYRAAPPERPSVETQTLGRLQVASAVEGPASDAVNPRRAPADAIAASRSTREASGAAPSTRGATANGSIGAVATLPSVPIPILPPPRSSEPHSSERPPGTAVSIAPSAAAPAQTARATARLQPIVLVAALAGVLAAVTVSALRDQVPATPARAAMTPVATPVVTRSSAPPSASAGPGFVEQRSPQQQGDAPVVDQGGRNRATNDHGEADRTVSDHGTGDRAWSDHPSSDRTPTDRVDEPSTTTALAGANVSAHASGHVIDPRVATHAFGPTKPAPLVKSVAAAPPAHSAAAAPAPTLATTTGVRPLRPIDVTNPYSP